MSNHGALEPTNMFITGPVAGFVSSAAIEKPIVSGNARSRITSVEPQFEQNPRLEPGEDSYQATVSSPESQLNEETVAGPHVQKAAPVAFRHIEQWQLPNGRSGSSTSNRTRLHRQEPTCATCAPCTTPNGWALSCRARCSGCLGVPKFQSQTLPRSDWNALWPGQLQHLVSRPASGEGYQLFFHWRPSIWRKSPPCFMTSILSSGFTSM